MGKKSIHQLDLDQLAHLFHVATGSDNEPDAIDPRSEPSASGKTPEKPEAFDLTQSLHTPVEQVGSWVGPYRLVSILGEGGMGIVYLADQTTPIRRRVALKVIKPGMDSARVVARFEAERQALALLDHPNIAQVHSAGTTDNGRLYFVMEYVMGLPITAYCDHHKFSIEERLGLFQKVCLAIQHAHQKGIIHRDIKPSNILVSTENDQHTLKIIDFGVAKAISQPLTERTLFTEDSQLIGTPEYMSPEQAEMANEDIDTRSDIYSLGVLLYELIAGVLPFDTTTLREGGIDHLRQVIRETDPKTPSTRLTKLGEQAKKVAASRRTEVTTLANRLRQELEWIPLKAMRKERAQRYRSASELADDIDNYLTGAPLIAGPLTTTYRLKKFMRRNRASAIAFAAVLATLIVGTIVSTLFAIKADRAHNEALSVANFLRTGVLGTVADARAGEATFSYVLDAASRNLEDEFVDKPLTEASIRETLGGTYRMLAESAKAEEQWLSALETYRQHYGEKHPSTMRAMAGLYWVYDDQERHHDAERLRTEMLQIGPATDEEPYAGNMGALAHTYHHLGKYKEAESLYNKIIWAVRREHGEDYIHRHPFIMCNLARVYADQGRYGEAEQLFRKILEAVNWPAENRWRLVFTADLACMYGDQGNYERAESLLTGVLEIERELFGNGHKHTLQSMCRLARVYTALTHYEDANDLLNEGLGLARHKLREGHPQTLRFVNALAELKTKQKQYENTEALFDEALNGRRHELGEQHPETLESKHGLAMLYIAQSRYNDAEPLLLEAFRGRQTKLGSTHLNTIESLKQLVSLYESLEKLEEAKKWRVELRDTKFAEK